MFIREVWEKITSFIFNSLSSFYSGNFKKVKVNLSQISLLNMWLLVEMFPLHVWNIAIVLQVYVQTDSNAGVLLWIF